MAVNNETNSLVGVTNIHVMTEIFEQMNQGRAVENVYGDRMDQPSSAGTQKMA